MDEAEKLITGLGSLAESLGFFHAQLIEKGFSRKEALELCIAYTTSLFGGKKSE